MEMLFDSFHNMYLVEKIINRKIVKNKKYYLIKWLCYPINQCTWEPKSSLKELNLLIQEFESKYPFSIDQEMYNLFCEEVKKSKKAKNKTKRLKESENEKDEKQFLAKKKKNDYFSNTELNDPIFDKLKAHLYINLNKTQEEKKKQSNEALIIDLSSANTLSEENIVINTEMPEEQKDISKLAMPKMV